MNISATSIAKPMALPAHKGPSDSLVHFKVAVENLTAARAITASVNSLLDATRPLAAAQKHLMLGRDGILSRDADLAAKLGASTLDLTSASVKATTLWAAMKFREIAKSPFHYDPSGLNSIIDTAKERVLDAIRLLETPKKAAA